MAKTKFTCSRMLFASACATAIASTGLANAQTNDSEDETVRELDTVTVTGIRSTIQDALETKREATGIVDGIAADEVLGLPNDNVAEILQRIPGIQIQRFQGRGENISIRGLPPRFARTTVNGQTLASAELSGFNYGFMESEIVNGVNVYKTPTADLDEGGLAGVIDIRTGDPLDRSKKRTVRVEGIYSQTLEEFTPRIGLSFVDQFMNERLGVMANFVYEDAARQFELLQIDNRRSVDLDNDGINEAEFPRRPRQRVEEYIGDAYTASLGVSFQATENLRLGATGIFAQEDGAFDLTSTRVDFNPVGAVEILGTDQPSVPGAGISVIDQQALNVVTSNVLVRRQDTGEVSALMLNADYENGPWEFSADFNTTSGESFFRNDPFFYNYRLDSARFISIAPDVYDIDNLALITDPALDDPNTFSGLNGRRQRAGEPIRLGVGSPLFEASDETSFQADLTRHFENAPFLSRLKTGLKFRDVNFQQRAQRVTFPGADLDAFPDYTENPGAATTDFLRQHRPDGLTATVLTYSLDELLSIRDGQNIEVVTDQLAQFFDANREIFALYALADFEHDFNGAVFKANIGGRYVETTQTNDAFENGATPFRTVGEYDEFLPSLNLSLEPKENLIFRASLSETLIRPGLAPANFNRVSNQVPDTNGNGDDVTRFTIRQGDPNLKPATADNLDLAIEYYFGESDAVYITYFDKTVVSGIATTDVCPTQFDGLSLTFDSGANECLDGAGNIYDISLRSNSDDEQSFKGVEVGLEKAFDFLPAPFDKTGITANYTYIDSDSGVTDPLSGASLPAQNLSEDSYNIRVYYDGDKLSGQLAYNYRSDFLAGLGGFQGQINQRAERGQLDFQTNYDLNERITLSLRALNVLGKPDYDYSATPDRFQTIGYAGRLYSLSATAKF